jgi:hypothetical protein
LAPPPPPPASLGPGPLYGRPHPLLQSSYPNHDVPSNLRPAGAAGVVYEAERLRTKERVAVKVINPTSFCLMPSTALQRCVVACRGLPVDSSSPGKVLDNLVNEFAFTIPNPRPSCRVVLCLVVPCGARSCGPLSDPL